MRLMKHKKGAELSMNVIIIAILAIIVLVIIAAFFTGGISGLIDIISGTKPGSLSTATQMCQSNCDIAMTMQTPGEKTNSKYCTQTWKLDANEDGKVDTTLGGDVMKNHCWESPINVLCGGVKDYCAAA